MIDKSSSEVTLDNVSVVCEFSEDLLGLLPDREFEFRIKLLLGLALVFIPSYRMAPVELKELNT